MLSVVIPTYNEQENLGPLLTRLAASRTQLGEPLEVLVVDDRSKDGTAIQAHRLLNEFGLGRIIERTGRRDLARAVWEGIQQAQGDLIGVMDADLSHPPELLPRLVEAVRKGNALAIASRFVPGGGVEHWPWARRMLSRVGNLTARPLVSVADATSGYFVGEAKVLKAVMVRPCGFKILLEILVRGCVHRVQEIPYVFRDRLRGSSKLGRRVLWCYATQLVRLYWYRLRRPCPHKFRE